MFFMRFAGCQKVSDRFVHTNTSHWHYHGPPQVEYTDQLPRSLIVPGPWLSCLPVLSTAQKINYINRIRGLPSFCSSPNSWIYFNIAMCGFPFGNGIDVQQFHGHRGRTWDWFWSSQQTKIRRRRQLWPSQKWTDCAQKIVVGRWAFFWESTSLQGSCEFQGVWHQLWWQKLSLKSSQICDKFPCCEPSNLMALW